MASGDIELAQPIQHLVFRHPSRPALDDGLGSVVEVTLDDRLECTIGPDPHIGVVAHPHLLQLVRDAIPDVVADVLRVRQDLVDPASRPWAAVLTLHMPAIQKIGDLLF